MGFPVVGPLGDSSALSAAVCLRSPVAVPLLIRDAFAVSDEPGTPTTQESSGRDDVTRSVPVKSDPAVDASGLFGSAPLFPLLLLLRCGVVYVQCGQDGQEEHRAHGWEEGKE